MFGHSSSTKLANLLRAKFNDGQRFMILCVIVGLLCGLAAVAFQFSIYYIFQTLWSLASSSSPPVFIALMLGAPTLAGLLVGIVVSNWVPEAVGSGIPQTKVAYYNRGGKVSTLTGIWRFVLGSLYVGLGNSLGREGPTVHFSAAISSRLGRWAFRDPRRVQSMLPVGMAAGIAAAFNAPLSALTFVFEELLDNFSMKALGGMVVSVVIAAAVSRTLLGEEPVLNTNLFEHYETSAWMLIAIPLGIASGFAGHFFSASVLGLRKKFRNTKIIPRWLTPAIGGLSCGFLGLFGWYLTAHFGQAQNSVFSLGYESLELAFENKLLISVVAILFVLKFAAVVLTYASGGSGGLFSPTLYLGGMLGGLIGIAFVQADSLATWLAFPDHDKVIGACVLLGMGAMFSAAVRCPFTSLIIIFEMTGNYSLILPLMAGNTLAYSLAKHLSPSSIYTALILQDGVTLRSFPGYRGAQDYRKLPIQAIMTHEIFTLPYEGSTGHSLKLVNETHQHFHAYPVLDKDDELKGVITLNELRSHPSETPIASLLEGQKLVSLTPDSSILAAARAMIEHHFKQVPVVSKTNPHKLLGWITMNDIARQQNAVE